MKIKILVVRYIFFYKGLIYLCDQYSYIIYVAIKLFYIYTLALINLIPEICNFQQYFSE